MTVDLTQEILNARYNSFLHDARGFLQCMTLRMDLLGLKNVSLKDSEDFLELQKDLARTNAFLDNAFIEEANVEKPFDVVLTTYDVVQKVTPMYQMCGKEIIFASGPNIFVLGKPVSFGRVVDNILMNGARYASSRAEIKFEEDHCGVRVIVSNDGPTIPRDIADKLFAAPPRAGSLHGYGLPNARRLIEGMHGSIDYKVSRNVGAFICTLPKVVGV